MIINPYDKAKLEKKFPNATFKPITGDYEKGKTYFCWYWHEYFEVIDVLHDVPIWGTEYVCKWEDGHINKHATAPDRKWDFEIVIDERRTT